MRRCLISIIPCIFATNIVTAAEPAWQGSKVDTQNKVGTLLNQLKVKSDEADASGNRSGEQLDIYLKGLGFQSLNELQTATVGTPVPTYSIHLDILRAIPTFTPDQINPWSLMIQSGDAIAPISVKGKIRSSAIVSISKQDPSKVKLGPLGSADDTKLLKEIEEQHCKCFVIRARPFNRSFLGEGDDTLNTFKIHVVTDGPGNLEKGQVLDAKKVMAELWAAAKNRKYDMRVGP